MSTDYFDLYYAGERQEGFSEEAVRREMATLFKTDAERIARYFNGHAEVIKLKVAEVTVPRYQAAMQAIGATLIVVPAGSEPPLVEAPASAEPVEVDTSALSLAQAGSELAQPQQPAEVVQVDVSSLSLSDSPAPLQQDKDDAPKPPDTSHLSLSGDA